MFVWIALASLRLETVARCYPQENAKAHNPIDAGACRIDGQRQGTRKYNQDSLPMYGRAKCGSTRSPDLADGLRKKERAASRA